MNICIVAKYYYGERVGGAEVQAWLLARELAARGHAVSYVCESLSGQGGTIETVDNVQIHWLKHVPYFNLLGLPIYGAALRKIHPDVVLHRYTSGYESAIGRYCRKHGAKFVWICTDNASPVRNRFVGMLREILNRKARPAYKRWPLFVHVWLKDRSREYGMRLVTHPCVQNSIQDRLFREQFGRKAFRFPSGHHIPESMPEKDKPPIALWVGGFSKVKRPELFLDVVKQCEDLGLEFVMISKSVPKDPHTPAQPFHDYVASTPHFQWLTNVPFEETLAWFDRAEIFISTSESEGFPNTFVQAWSRGMPVVSFDVDPNGILSNPDLGRCIATIDEARDAICAYLNGPVGARQRRQDYARSHFSIAHVADHLLEILDQTPDSLDD
jgi:glycosyltransferase involved in cell wall biosynthesis